MSEHTARNDGVTRGATENVALGLLALQVAEPYIDMLVDKVTQPEPESQIVIPPGTHRPGEDD